MLVQVAIQSSRRWRCRVQDVVMARPTSVVAERHLRSFYYACDFTRTSQTTDSSKGETLAAGKGSEGGNSQTTSSQQTSGDPAESDGVQPTSTESTELIKAETWDGAENGECQMPPTSNVTLTNLTEFAGQDSVVTSINLENCVYGLTPAGVPTTLANQQLRPIANQFSTNTTTLFATGNYPHIITTPAQPGLQGFTAGSANLPAMSGYLYAQAGPQASPVAGFSLVPQPIRYQAAPVNTAVKTSTEERTSTTEQVTQQLQQQQQQQQQQPEDTTEIQPVQNVAFAGNAFPPGSYAGVLPTGQAYANPYLAQQPNLQGKTFCFVFIQGWEEILKIWDCT